MYLVAQLGLWAVSSPAGSTSSSFQTQLLSNPAGFVGCVKPNWVIPKPNFCCQMRITRRMTWSNPTEFVGCVKLIGFKTQLLPNPVVFKTQLLSNPAPVSRTRDHNGRRALSVIPQGGRSPAPLAIYDGRNPPGDSTHSDVSVK
jgi:hypothetical protein